MFSAYSAAFWRQLPPSPSVPRISLSPMFPPVCLQDSRPILVCWQMSLAAPRAALGTEGGASSALAKSLLLMPAPICTPDREGEIPLLWESWEGGVSD